MLRIFHSRTSLVVQQLRLCAPNAGGPGSIPGWGAGSCMHAATKILHATTKSLHDETKRSLMLQLKILHAAMMIMCAATKTQCSQINKQINFKKNILGGDLQDGRGVRHGDHLPLHKYIRNTSTCGTTPTEHLLNAGRRPQTSQKARNSPYA